jgi:hypothetical protein
MTYGLVQLKLYKNYVFDEILPAMWGSEPANVHVTKRYERTLLF